MVGGQSQTMTDDPVEVAREEVAEAMARSAEVWGINRSYGRLFGYLYFAEEPKSLDELAEESGYAKSTVSNGMSELERYHLIRRRSLPGEGRKAYFEAETDFWRIIQGIVADLGRRELSIMRRALDDAETTLENAPDTDRVEFAEARVENLQRLYDQFERAMNVMTSTPIEKLVEMFTSRDEEP